MLDMSCILDILSILCISYILYTFKLFFLYILYILIVLYVLHSLYVSVCYSNHLYDYWCLFTKLNAGGPSQFASSMWVVVAWLAGSADDYAM